MVLRPVWDPSKSDLPTGQIFPRLRDSVAARHNVLALDRLIRVEKCIHLLRVVHQHRRYGSEERNNQQ